MPDVIDAILDRQQERIEAAWGTYLALLHRTDALTRKDETELQQCMEVLALTADQAREHLRIVARRRELRETIERADEMRTQAQAAQEGVRAARERVKQLEQEIESTQKLMRSHNYEATRLHTAIGNARGEAERIDQDFPHLFSHEMPSPHTPVGKKHWQQVLDQAEREITQHRRGENDPGGVKMLNLHKRRDEAARMLRMA